MRSILEMWRADRRSRWFFAVHLQGALGVGLSYVALMVIAYERIGSTWAASAVLLADGVVAIVALAVVLGMGNALFRPATSALLPALVGPACAAGVLLFTGPEACSRSTRRPSSSRRCCSPACVAWGGLPSLLARRCCPTPAPASAPRCATP